MKEITNNMKQRNNYILLAITTFMVALLLVGCSSEATAETVKTEPEAVVNEDTPTVEEIKVPEEATIVKETVVEEPAEELYIPEGIDMESTLPGEEWVASFVGNVAEPVVVVYNDDSGRKEVVQATKEITINPDEDTIAVYWPEEGMHTKYHAISITKSICFQNYEINIFDVERLRSVPERPAKITVTGGVEDWVIEFTILVE